MELKKIKSNIKEIKRGHKFEGLFSFVYEDSDITKSFQSTLLAMRDRGLTINTRPKVGDIVFFKQFRDGVYAGRSFVGVVSRSGRKNFSFLREDDSQERLASYNFGGTRGLVLQGFMTVADKEINDLED